MSNLGAIVLCGGRSRRMGRPKAWLPFGPETLLARVVRLLTTRADAIVVVAAPGQDLPPLPPGTLIARDPIEDLGPLHGLLTGCRSLDNRVEWTYATSTDVPFLQPAWIDRLTESTNNQDVILPCIDGFEQPLAALYRVSAVIPAAEELIAAKRLRPVFLRESLRFRILNAEDLRQADPQFATLRNLNDPTSYAAALVDAGFGDQIPDWALDPGSNP